MTESWLFALVAAVIAFIAIAFALFITGEQFYIPSFFLVLAVVAIFEVLLIMYFGVLGMKGYVPIGIAFGFSGTFIRLGITTDNVAKKLVISPYTVNTHIRHVYEKIGIHKRSELIDYINGNGSGESGN